MIPIGDVSYAQQRYNSYEANHELNRRQAIYDEYRRIFTITDPDWWHDWIQQVKSQKKIYYWDSEYLFQIHYFRNLTGYYRLTAAPGTIIWPVGHYDPYGGFGAAKEGV